MVIKKTRFSNCLLVVYYAFISNLIHASGSGLLRLTDVLSVPNFNETQGVVVEFYDFSKANQIATNTNINAARYAWKNGDFIFENGLYESKSSNRLSIVYSAMGRFKGKNWEYSRNRLIEHGNSNSNERSVARKAAHELNFIQYLSKGMEVDDFATIEVKTNGSFSGKWVSTHPVQLMSGNLVFLGEKRVRLNAWTPDRLLQFESEIEYDFSVSKIIPASIQFRYIFEGVPSSYQVRKVVFVDLKYSDAEFDPRLRYDINRTLQLENDVLSETNGFGKKVVFIASNYTDTPSRVRRLLIISIFFISSVGVFIWLKNKNKNDK